MLDLGAAGRPVAQAAFGLDISDQVIYNWRRQHLVDTGQLRGLRSGENAELVAACKRIVELETELVVHRRLADLFGEGGAREGGSRPSRRFRLERQRRWRINPATAIWPYR